MDIKNVSDAKFRTITIAVTAVICVAIIVIGVVYVTKLRERSNADYSEAQTTETTSETTTAETTAIAETTTIAETTIVPESTEISETTAETTIETAAFDVDSMTIDDIGIKAKASADGCVFRWKCEEDAMKNCVIGIEITDGRSDYKTAGKALLSAKRFDVTTEKAADTISARITVSKPDGTVIFVKSITVENNTYVQTTSTSKIDISSLFA